MKSSQVKAKVKVSVQVNEQVKVKSSESEINYLQQSYRYQDLIVE